MKIIFCKRVFDQEVSMNLLMEFIVSNNYSFTLVEEAAFRASCTSLNAKVQPVPGTIREIIILFF